ncbi:MAG: hypothetical protein K1X29_00405 [Bdellovibrionales bacterium]|nr:hypothetical protein [Bdellovibrionales bacterium]
MNYLLIITFPIMVFYLFQFFSNTLLLQAQEINNTSKNFYWNWFVDSVSKISLNSYLRELFRILNEIYSADFILFSFLISFCILYKKNISNQLKFFWIIAAFGFIFPVILYSSSVAYDNRYLIYSYPIFILTSQLVLADWIGPFIPLTLKLRIKNSIIPTSVFLLSLIVVIKLVIFVVNKESWTLTEPRLPIANHFFYDEELVLSNKSAATLITGSRKLAMLPSYEEFYSGENSLVSTIVIFFDHICDFINPKEEIGWINKDNLIDHKGNTFKLEANLSSKEIKIYTRKNSH